MERNKQNKPDGIWRQGHLKDVEELADLFWTHLTEHPEYISHGELQMGVASAPGIVAKNGKEILKEYIRKKIEGAQRNYFSTEGAMLKEETDAEWLSAGKFPSAVFIYEVEGKTAAFCVLDTACDGSSPFGIICDMLVSLSFRGCGIGKQMLELARKWFRNMGITDIYLESGINNHAAHAFFDRQGFKKVSHIFKLE